jgi:hypothetical protein
MLNISVAVFALALGDASASASAPAAPKTRQLAHFGSEPDQWLKAANVTSRHVPMSD